jgi:membrane-bound lytic murein transglycosylase B
MRGLAARSLAACLIGLAPAVLTWPAAAVTPERPPGTPTILPSPAFSAYLGELRQAAQRAGITEPTIAAAFAAIDGLDRRVVDTTRRQSEFSAPIGTYVKGAADPARVGRGRALATQWRAALDAAERRFGVSREIVLAVWGLESGFGANTGGFPVLRSLASLAYAGERRALFEGEFLAALRILDEEHVSPGEMTGSWAGAMGQAQFMPSTFLGAAIDGDGDGRRDIWRSVPDVLASIPNLLARSGWQPGLPAAIAVTLPGGLDLAVYRRSLAGWAASNVAPRGGGTLPKQGDASLFLPAGIAGPAFLLTDNFEALRAYNTSDAYALGVSRLADGIAGTGGPALLWPSTPALDAAERREVQERLVARGLYAGTPDGRFGAKTRDAVRQFQIRQGLVPDAFADRGLLQALRGP